MAYDANAPIVVPTELVVILNPHNLGFSEFIGTRAMLEAEGIIPDGTKWPEGYNDLRWQDGKFNFWLRRQRPEGVKGPRRDFAECDWWCVRWELTNRPSLGEHKILLKAQALKNEIYRQSAEGQAEWIKNWNRHNETTKDEKFQAFKALIPGLVRPKRGRCPKHAGQSQGASA